MKTVFDAVNEFKGDFPSTPSFKGFGEEWLILLCKQGTREDGDKWSEGSMYQGCTEFNGSYFEQVSTFDQFNDLVSEMKTNFGKCEQSYSDYKIEYQLAPHCSYGSGATTNKDKELDMDRISEACCSACNYDFNCKVSEAKTMPCPRCGDTPEPRRAKATFTQEMADNGILPSVGMECCYSSLSRIVWNKCTIIAYYDGFVWTSDNGIRQLNLTAFKPLTPPITLIDGKAYQFDYKGLSKVHGIHCESEGAFITRTDVMKISNCISIQPLTVEVK